MVHVARGGRLIGLIAIADAVRPTSRETIAKLQARGVKVAMLTGDNQATAERIGRNWASTSCLRMCCPGRRPPRSRNCSSRVTRSAWSATASTTLRR
ncbi:HAD family hydrolase [Pseudomonas aeruginosa]|nr:HAD family hydrolase [Pseudomonas aeruginosa]